MTERPRPRPRPTLHVYEVTKAPEAALVWNGAVSEWLSELLFERRSTPQYQRVADLYTRWETRTVMILCLNDVKARRDWVRQLLRWYNKYMGRFDYNTKRPRPGYTIQLIWRLGARIQHFEDYYELTPDEHVYLATQGRTPRTRMNQGKTRDPLQEKGPSLQYKQRRERG